MSQLARSLLASLVLGALLVALGADGRRGGALAAFRIEAVENGFGRLLPHRIPVPDDAGLPTGDVVDILSLGDLVDNARPMNPILPPASWPTQAVLPNGDAGNHFLVARFTDGIDVGSVLTGLRSALPNASLTGSITVEVFDPSQHARKQVRGRAFIGGRTYGSVDPRDPTRLLLEQWVTLDSSGKPVASDPRGLGFPGTESATGFPGAGALVDPESFVFVPDSDGDLTTHETFPAGVHVQLRVTRHVTSRERRLSEPGLASSTVGPDKLPPEVRVRGAARLPAIVPGNGATGVDPRTDVEVCFTEPIQVLTVGDLDQGTPPALSPAIQLRFGPASAEVDVPFHVIPVSVFDFSRLRLTPLFAFPGSGPDLPGGITCGDLARIDVVVNPGLIEDLSGSASTRLVSTSFETGEGPALVNAPVAPDAIYVARGGGAPGISVIDLNGFGQGCGDPTYDFLNPIVRGNTNFPNNPNVALQGSLMIPPLAPGTCVIDGGSAGVLSLARDSSLRDLVAGAPLIESVGDMALGHPLDLTFDDGSPFGCQAGGGNLCAQTGLKVVSVATNGSPDTVQPFDGTGMLLKTEVGAGNPISWSPHPNPPRLVFPPLCASPLIAGEEPTSIVTSLPPPAGPGLTNLLVPSSNPFGIPDVGLPPQGLLVEEQNAFFQGPSPPQPVITACRPYMIRQQIGHFLYVVDRSAGEVVVLDSNHFAVMERIPLPDPTSLAMSPDLQFLAVTNQGADLVSFIDVDPLSSTFHHVVQTTAVGLKPTGIAWTPDDEDILVCNRGDQTLSVISAFSLTVRKTVASPYLSSPFEVAITPRQQPGIGLSRNVWFAYVLNADGTVAIYESGPSGINGWGYDDVIGVVPFVFDAPKAIQADPTTLDSGFWVVHENQLDPAGNPTGVPGGAVTRCGIVGGTMGQIPLDPSMPDPMIRDLDFGISVSIGGDELTGLPVDLAFDDQMNVGVLTNASTPFSAGLPLSVNGKSLAKVTPAGFRTANNPRLLFLAVPSSTEGPGVIDVVELATHQRLDTNPFEPGTQSIPVPGAFGVVDYFRQ